MAVGFKVGSIFYKIGTGSFLHCFFSNIAYHLEDGKWGSKFPHLMNSLYKGSLANEHIDALEQELNEVRESFLQYHPPCTEL